MISTEKCLPEMSWLVVFVLSNEIDILRLNALLTYYSDTNQ